MTPAYFAKVRPTYIENWSGGLCRLSIPQDAVPLSLDEARAFGLRNRKFGRWFGQGSTPPVDRVVEKLNIVLRNYPDGAFVRLGSRSAKDSSYARHYGLKVTCAEAAVRMLTDDSERIVFDLRLALRHNYSPHIFVRQWLEIPAWSEFRCFMKGRRLVGISQYDCKNLGHCPRIAECSGQIREGIELFFDKIREASHLDDLVFDVLVDLNERNSGLAVDVKLLELNPFFERTDACLFSWHNGGDFDGSFRFL